ncbi:MAG: DUF6691 family protein [Oligoflexales bacterium]
MQYVIAFVSAFLFSVGLAFSGMTDPKKVIGFLDIFGDFNPQLILVMVGAILFHSISYFLIKKKPSPLLTEKFLIPGNKNIDWRLILGSMLFGIGWGVGGFCPGPAVASLVSFSDAVITFSISMVLGIAAYHYFFKPYVFEVKS